MRSIAIRFVNVKRGPSDGSKVGFSRLPQRGVARLTRLIQLKFIFTQVLIIVLVAYCLQILASLVEIVEACVQRTDNIGNYVHLYPHDDLYEFK